MNQSFDVVLIVNVSATKSSFIHHYVDSKQRRFSDAITAVTFNIAVPDGGACWLYVANIDAGTVVARRPLIVHRSFALL